MFNKFNLNDKPSHTKQRKKSLATEREFYPKELRGIIHQALLVEPLIGESASQKLSKKSFKVVEYHRSGLTVNNSTKKTVTSS